MAPRAYVEGQRLGKGIRFRKGKIDAQVLGNGKWHCKRFPPETPMHFVEAWTQTMRQNALVEKVERERASMPRPVPVVPRDDLKGYCYIYFIRAGLNVKIGRALDPDRRLDEMQVGQPQPLRLLVAVPAHASLEAVLHRRFAHLRGNGEWFHLSDELQAFIAGLQSGRNPVAMLWADLVYLDAKRTRRKPINVLTTAPNELKAILGIDSPAS